MKNFALLLIIAAAALYYIHHKTTMLDSIVEQYLPALAEQKKAAISKNPPAEIPLETAAPTPSQFLDLKSKDGRTIQVRILEVTADQVRVERNDGKPFDIPLANLDPGTVSILQAITTFPYP